MPIVSRVGQEVREQVAETVALSFADDPIWKWIYQRDEILELDEAMVLARMLVARTSAVDEIHATTDHGAVALWTAPAELSTAEIEQTRDESGAEFAMAFAEQMGERTAKVGKLSAAMANQRPDEAHWYLGILGTHPSSQNQGLGSAVLSTMLEKTDRLGLPTFLESSNPRNYGFYQRHGYSPVHELIVEDSPPLLGFHRPPR